MNPGILETFPDMEAAGRRAASLTARAARLAARERGRFALALSGGTTPGRYFDFLVEQELPWDVGHVFWADERLGPLDSPDSNYRLAKERLLSRVAIPEANIHLMAGDPGAGVEAAGNYEKELREFFGDSPPAFDAVHLGIGADGHTASLFPGQPALEEASRWVVPVQYAGAIPPVPRISLTLPVLNAARLVVFLVSGAGKLKLAREVTEGGGEAYPASRVRPALPPVWLAGDV